MAQAPRAVSWARMQVIGEDAQMRQCCCHPHFEGCGIVFVPFRFAVARERGVIAHGAKPMRPTIINAAAFGRDGSGGGGHGCDRRWCDSGSSSVGRRRGGDGSAVCAMKSCVASGEAPNAFFGTELEFAFE